MAASRLSIKEITLLTASNEIMLVGTVHKNNLSYDSRFGISSTQLNQIINNLQKINPNDEVASMFKSEQVGYNELMYTLNGLSFSSNTIDMDCFDNFQELKQIRA